VATNIPVPFRNANEGDAIRADDHLRVFHSYNRPLRNRELLWDSAHPRVSAPTAPSKWSIAQNQVHAVSSSSSSESTEKPTGACQGRVWHHRGFRSRQRLSAWPIQPRKRFLVPFTNAGEQPMPIRGSIVFRCSSSRLNHSLHSGRTGSPKQTAIRYRFVSELVATHQKHADEVAQAELEQ
jgi:hypothetical protein